MQVLTERTMDEELVRTNFKRFGLRFTDFTLVDRYAIAVPVVVRLRCNRGRA
jgi:hypothetical protein